MGTQIIGKFLYGDPDSTPSVPFNSSYWAESEHWLVRELRWCHSRRIDLVYIALLLAGLVVGFSMGWGSVKQKVGCSFLLAVPAILFAILWLDPLLSGERQSSTAGLAIPIGSFWVGVTAAAGVSIGVITRTLVKR